MIRSMLYATDLGVYAPFVMQHALALARTFGAELYVIHAVEPMGQFAESLLQSYLDEQTLDQLHSQGVNTVMANIEQRVLENFRDELGEEADLAVIKAVRGGWPERRLVMVYQPHRYSRTRDLYDDFVQVLGEANVLLLVEVYPAGEEPIPGADSRQLCHSIRQRGQLDPIYVERGADLAPLLKPLLRAGDILLCQGAGDIGAVAPQLIKHPLFVGESK